MKTADFEHPDKDFHLHAHFKRRKLVHATLIGPNDVHQEVPVALFTDVLAAPSWLDAMAIIRGGAS